MRLRPRTDRRQGILPFVLKLGEREDVTSRAGLPLVVEASRALRLDDEARDLLGPPRRKGDYGPDEQLETLSTLIAAGGDRVEDIRILGEDKGLVRLLGRPFASPDSLLDFLKSFHDQKCWANRPKDKKTFVPQESTKLQALDNLNRILVLRAADPNTTTATIDHDGTIPDARVHVLLTLRHLQPCTEAVHPAGWTPATLPGPCPRQNEVKTAPPGVEERFYGRRPALDCLKTQCYP